MRTLCLLFSEICKAFMFSLDQGFAKLLDQQSATPGVANHNNGFAKKVNKILFFIKVIFTDKYCKAIRFKSEDDR